MKTKLLKKVRKRFSIIRYDKIEDPNDPLFEALIDESLFPIYALYDEKFEFFISYQYSYDDIYKELVKRIRKKYYYTKKNKYTHQSKVWYNDNSKEYRD